MEERWWHVARGRTLPIVIKWFCGKISVVKACGKVMTVERSACALSVEESLALLGCGFRLELILLFRQCAVLLFNKSAGRRCFEHGGVYWASQRGVWAGLRVERILACYASANLGTRMRANIKKRVPQIPANFKTRIMQ
jgi:hypothetical protein